MKHLKKPLFIFILTLAALLCMAVAASAASEEPAEEVAEEPVPLSDAFGDLGYSENETALRYMIDGGYIAGYTDGSFRPGRSYTRLELAQLVSTLCALDTAKAADSGFYDCEIYGAEAINAAVEAELMTGRSIQSFDPYGSVLKAEMIGTLEKAAALLSLEGFYDHATGEFTKWATDYTICTADEAMACAYQLAQAMELKAAAEAEAEAAAQAALAVAELNGASAEPETTGEMTEAAEPEVITDAAEEATEETAEGEDADDAASAEPTEASEEPTEASEEPAAASEEPAEEIESTQTEPNTQPPAGVITPDSSAAQSSQPTPAPAAAADSTAAETETEEPDEADALRDSIIEIYENVKTTIVDFLKGLFG